MFAAVAVTFGIAEREKANRAPAGVGPARGRWRSGILEEGNELLDAQPRLTDDGPQGAAVQFTMTGHREATMGRQLMSHRHMAALLRIQLIPELAECANDLPAPEGG